MRVRRNFLAAVSLLIFSLSPVLAMPQPTPAPELISLEVRATCDADNCLRAARGNLKSAIPFCSIYTSQPTATIQAWAANCQNNPTRVTSACNCLAVRASTPR